jgi:hypothetical protein
VYYAGHGVLDDDGRLHLARPDTSMDHAGPAYPSTCSNEISAAQEPARGYWCWTVVSPDARAPRWPIHAASLLVSLTCRVPTPLPRPPRPHPRAAGQAIHLVHQRVARRAGPTRPAHPGRHLPPDRR